jgi:hypothetical protein
MNLTSVAKKTPRAAYRELLPVVLDTLTISPCPGDGGMLNDNQTFFHMFLRVGTCCSLSFIFLFPLSIGTVHTI